MAGKRKKTKKKNKQKPKRVYLSQSDVPSFSIEQAIRIPQAISDNYAGAPVSPLHLASALDMAPTSPRFRQLCGASIAYGLTEGGYNANKVILKKLGKRIVKPLKEKDDLSAKREALLNPRVTGEFLRKYDGSPLPRQAIAINVLEEMGVPTNKTESVFSLINDSAESLGLLRKIKDKQYVDLTGVEIKRKDEPGEEIVEEYKEEQAEERTEEETIPGDSVPSAVTTQANRRVFITHGKNKSFIDPIKKLLGFGELIPVVSVEKQSVSKPVTDKVMDDMRSCGAAIIHVEAEQKLIDQDANEHTIINPNVLIEIGAAMALYGRRFILLVREGVELPSNLQGLYEVRYKGNSLDVDATVRLLEAINDIKSNPLPDR